MTAIHQQKLLPERKAFHQVIDSNETDIFYLKNRHNVRAAITNFGARLVNLVIPVNLDILESLDLL